ncbi:hypothetical protein [Streptacidiphilus sp. MAP5-3]|uniref:hypothetical protein n=1 Tax=unclassified Streptacidiphilus TaxID=2643834 RepID=UPI0035116B8F
MTTLFTVLALVAMISACALLIQLANARHAALPTTAQPHRWHLHRLGTGARRTKRGP